MYTLWPEFYLHQSGVPASQPPRHRLTVAALSFYTAPMEKYRRPLKGRQNDSYCRLKDAPLAQNNVSHFHVNRLPQRLNKLGGDWPNGYSPLCGKRSLSLIPFCNQNRYCEAAAACLTTRFPEKIV